MRRTPRGGATASSGDGMIGDCLRRLARLACALCLLAAVTGLSRAEEEEDKYASIRAQLQICETCHGPRGQSEQAQYPILAGQHFYYLYVQLKDYQSGLRENPIMQPIAAPLEQKQMQLLARYFSEQEWPDVDTKTPEQDKQTGRRVIGSGQCVACHLDGFEGNSRVPRLSGQHTGYLARTMKDFKHRLRRNSPAKDALFQTFSAEEIEATAKYLRGYANNGAR